MTVDVENLILALLIEKREKNSKCNPGDKSLNSVPIIHSLLQLPVSLLGIIIIRYGYEVLFEKERNYGTKARYNKFSHYLCAIEYVEKILNLTGVDIS